MRRLRHGNSKPLFLFSSPYVVDISFSEIDGESTATLSYPGSNLLTLLHWCLDRLVASRTLGSGVGRG